MNKTFTADMGGLEVLSECELQTMNILWDLNTPTKPSVIAAYLRSRYNKEWSGNTFFTMIKRLRKKGYIDFEGTAHNRMYYPIVSESDYKVDAIKRFTNLYFDGDKDKLIEYTNKLWEVM